MLKDELKVSVIQEPVQPTDETFPQVSKALIKKLEKTFRDKCPELCQSEREIFFRVGQVSVVTYLRIEHERQQNKG